MANVVTMQEKKEFIIEFVNGIQARQTLSDKDVLAKAAKRTVITSPTYTQESNEGNTYKFWYTNLIDEPVYENIVKPALAEFLSDAETIESFETISDLRSHMNTEFLNKCSVSVSLFEDDEMYENAEIGNGIEISGVPRSYQIETEDGETIDRIGLRLSVVHQVERAKVGGKKLTEGLLDLMNW